MSDRRERETSDEKLYSEPAHTSGYMSAWECAIDDCGATFEGVEDAIVHQVTDHQRTECKVCGSVVPDGYFAIRHTFEEHSRADYVRAYGANASDVRQRERIKDAIETDVDLQAVVDRLDEVSGGSLTG